MPKKPCLLFCVLFLFFFSLFIGVDRFIHRKARHFSLSKISMAYEPCDDWEIPALQNEEKKEVDKILDQSFSFFGKSTHAYLFLSQDHKYVLKFVKQNDMRPQSWLVYIPFSFNPYFREYTQKLKEQKKILNAYKTAYMDFKEETGLVYVHINRSSSLNKKISISDKRGKKYIVDLDNTSFYIQKRAQLIYPRIAELMRAGDIAQTKNIIASVFSLISLLDKKGVCDKDLSVYKNFGIIDDKAVQLAISKIQIASENTDYCYRQTISAITEPFRIWIKKNYPELLEFFDEQSKSTT